jgi:hypothetical protein
LYHYGELDEASGKKLESHLADCPRCRESLQEFREVFDLLDSQEEEVASQLLWQARERLLRQLGTEPRTASGMLNSLWALFGAVRPAYVAASILLLAAGFAFGYLTFQTVSGTPILAESDIDPFSSANMRISNVKFQETSPESRQVELSFTASRELRIRGSVNDPRVQRLLAYALINEDNPGVRLQAVNTIGAGEIPDQEIRSALIAALKMDENPAVRAQALAALSNFPAGPDIESALLSVLQFDQNARLRIEAINLLEKMISTDAAVESDVIGVLEDKVRNDENQFIRDRALSVLSRAGYESF